MKKTGAALVRYALEQLPISFTFGIPGVHNTEIYDELNQSEKIRPILVTHECGAAFMADGISRTSENHEIGTLLIVPAAGMTHAMSGIGEAFLDGIPMLVISGGTRTDVPFGFQLHELDQGKILSGITKGYWKVESHEQIIPTIYEAYTLATSGVPGPVFVEIPANLQLFQGEVNELLKYQKPTPATVDFSSELKRAVEMLTTAKSPALFVGWGAVDVADSIIYIAEMLGAPVSTTLQGLSVFPGSNPLSVGMGFSGAAVPAAENAFKDCDCLLAIGTNFGEIPTGSFSCKVPENLIHIDINPNAINRNFKSKIGIVGDAKIIVPQLKELLVAQSIDQKERRARVASKIEMDKSKYRLDWSQHRNERVNPSLFFEELRRQLPDDGLMVVDDGNHTFLAAELFEVRKPRSFISPTDFNCMGYAVPAAIGAKLANPEKSVVSIVGDGAFLMTGLEILTATSEGAGIVYFVFYDGELSQISQGQQIPYGRKTCTVIGNVKLEGIAMATGAKYISLENNTQMRDKITQALRVSQSGQPVIVEVRIDYSKRTRFTSGVVKAVLKRFPLGDKFRFIGRAMMRKLTG